MPHSKVVKSGVVVDPKKVKHRAIGPRPGKVVNCVLCGSDMFPIKELQRAAELNRERGLPDPLSITNSNFEGQTPCCRHSLCSTCITAEKNKEGKVSECIFCLHPTLRNQLKRNCPSEWECIEPAGGYRYYQPCHAQDCQWCHKVSINEKQALRMLRINYMIEEYIRLFFCGAISFDEMPDEAKEAYSILKDNGYTTEVDGMIFMHEAVSKNIGKGVEYILANFKDKEFLL